GERSARCGFLKRYGCCLSEAAQQVPALAFLQSDVPLLKTGVAVLCGPDPHTPDHVAPPLTSPLATYGRTIFFGSTTRLNSSSPTNPSCSAASLRVRSWSIAK